MIRTKRICYFSENTDMSYLFEQAGVQKKLTECGQWYATAPEEELARLMASEPGLMRDWDDRYGDREKNKRWKVTRQQLWSTRIEFTFKHGTPLAYLDGRKFSVSPEFTLNA